MINGSIVQNDSIVTIARAAIEYVDKIKNIEINGMALSRLKMLIGSLIDACNLRLLTSFPIVIEDRPINEIEFEIRNCYFPGLEFSKMKSFVIDALEEAERLSDIPRCLDALRVLVNYTNIVVFSRFNHGLELRDRNIRAIYE